jgi:hypothetical protein
MIFNRFDHAAHCLNATLLWPARGGKVLVAIQFSAVLIETLHASTHILKRAPQPANMRFVRELLNIVTLLLQIWARLLFLVQYAD